MRSLGTRRAALLAGAAAVAVVALTGCSAGQVAETALKKPSVYGVNTQNSNGSVLIRGLAVTYNGPEGYEKGADAPLEVNLFNQTTESITVLISSAPAESAVSGTSVGLVGAASDEGSSQAPEPSGSRPAAVPNTSNGPSDSVTQPSTQPSLDPVPGASGVSGAGARPARIEIGPQNTVSFRPGDSESLVVSGLSDALVPGGQLGLVFEFSNGADQLATLAPVSIPFSPAPRESGENELE